MFNFQYFIYLVSSQHAIRTKNAINYYTTPVARSSTCRSERDVYRWVSSAYKWYLRDCFEIIEPRGVVKRVKRSGPSTEPWGTPQERVENAEMESLIETT